MKPFCYLNRGMDSARNQSFKSVLNVFAFLRPNITKLVDTVVKNSVCFKYSTISFSDYPSVALFSYSLVVKEYIVVNNWCLRMPSVQWLDGASKICTRHELRSQKLLYSLSLNNLILSEIVKQEHLGNLAKQ